MIYRRISTAPRPNTPPSAKPINTRWSMFDFNIPLLIERGGYDNIPKIKLKHGPHAAIDHFKNVNRPQSTSASFKIRLGAGLDSSSVLLIHLNTMLQNMEI
ncbi:hypothetical protein GWI33_008818 [Rhynchophorus ferrugineus]|uniref:Uncharacterized protein n=1 Tax=Rhynchophorus ferrugineus TaxID=354439 RepID=A0A834IFK9_RHYFE|nr:hypothetical protein GWI33_008818 [Rhynchophorus ferrugineus]